MEDFTNVQERLLTNIQSKMKKSPKKAMKVRKLNFDHVFFVVAQKSHNRSATGPLSTPRSDLNFLG